MYKHKIYGYSRTSNIYHNNIISTYFHFGVRLFFCFIFFVNNMTQPGEVNYDQGPIEPQMVNHRHNNGDHVRSQKDQGRRPNLK